MSYLNDAKNVLRVSESDMDTEINDLITAAMDDMVASGVTAEAVGSSNSLVKRAIMAYVKANFGWDNPESEKLMASYLSIVNKLSLGTETRYFAVTFSVTSGGSPVREAIVTLDGESLETGAAGVVTFYKPAGNNYLYTVSADGYESDSDDDNLIDVVDSSVTVAISLTAV